MKYTGLLTQLGIQISMICVLILICGVVSMNAQNVKNLFHQFVKAQEDKSSEQATHLLNVVLGDEDLKAEQVLEQARSLMKSGRVYYGFMYYEKFLQLDPDHQNIRLEYAQTLYQKGKLKRAEDQIKMYLAKGGDSINALEMLGNMLLWKAEYSEAKVVFEKLLTKSPGNKLALNGITEIDRIKSPYLSAQYQYFSDDQPLQSHELQSSYNQYINAFLAPSVSGNLSKLHSMDSSISISSSLLHVELGNTLHWHSKKFKAKVKGGYFYQAGSGGDFSYEVQFVKKLPFDVNAHLKLERNPYLLTISSLADIVYVDEFSIKLQRPFNKVINGEVAWLSREFIDGNTGQNVYAYLMGSIYTGDHWILKAGYGFNYDDMDESRFEPTMSLQELIDNNEFENIPGRYNPYFTPEEQINHSLLLNVSWHPSAKWKLFSNVSWGLYAKSQIPFLFLSETASGQLIVKRDFEQIEQQVREFSLGAKFELSKGLSCTLLGRYEKLFFFERIGMQAGLNWQL